ncbi:hypothetical protein BJ742DRAFT_816784 [Cladochytrium replicatum]|nr:hypothetical protein BJ742DRAFT_816784 [Cladochytrium replicatum]
MLAAANKPRASTAVWRAILPGVSQHKVLLPRLRFFASAPNVSKPQRITIRNRDIPLDEVTVIGEKGEKLGKMSVEKALQTVVDLKFHDLVLVNSASGTAKIVRKVAAGSGSSDAGLANSKTQPLASKEITPQITPPSNEPRKPSPKEEESKSKPQKTKELQISTSISPHDLSIKIDRAVQSLSKANLEVTVSLKSQKKTPGVAPGASVAEISQKVQSLLKAHQGVVLERVLMKDNRKWIALFKKNT